MNQLDRIEAKLDKILAEIAELPGRLPTPPQEGGGARQAAMAVHDAKWEPIKKRWPKFMVTPKSCQAYDTHCEAMDGEPTNAEMDEWMTKLKEGREYPRARLEQIFEVGFEEAQAMISFLKWSGRAVWKNKGIALANNYKSAE